MLRPEEWSRNDDSGIGLTGLQIPLGPGAGGRRNGSILAITDKISKALNEFDQLYNEEEADNLLVEVYDQVNMLESGQLKVQLKSFINNYKDMSASMDEVKNERDDILLSLADWFTADHMQTFNGVPANEDDMDSNAHSFQDHILNTKMQFEKLKSMSENIQMNASRGRDVSSLEQEREKMKREVMTNFKTAQKSAAAANKVAQKKEVDMAWKYAAEEICTLLHRARDNGMTYAIELEKEINGLLEKMKNQANQLERSMAECQEKTLMIKKWKDDNKALMNDKASLEGQVKKLKRQLKKTRQALSKHEYVQPALLEEAEGEDDHSNGDRSKATAGGDVNTVDKLQGRLKDSQKEVSDLVREKDEIKKKLDDLSTELGEKDEIIESLGHDKAELTRQMKLANLKPDERRLSMYSKSTPNTSRTGNLNFSGSVTGVAVQLSSDHVPGEKCSHCGCECQMGKTSESRLAASRTNIKAAKRTAGSKTANGDVSRKGHVIKAKAMGSHTHKKRPLVENDMETLHGTNEEQEQIIKELKLQLLAAQKELRTLKSTNTSAPYPTPVATADPAANGLDPIKVTVQEYVQKDWGEERPADIMTLDQKQQDDIKVIMEQAHTPADLKHEVEMKDSIHGEGSFTSMGIQTDPKLDPLSAWSQGSPSDRKDGWRPPMPPLNWVNFDPTAACAVSANKLNRSVGMSMLQGAEPREIEMTAKKAATFVEREILRSTSDGTEHLDNLLVSQETQDAADSQRFTEAHATDITVTGNRRKSVEDKDVLRLRWELLPVEEKIKAHVRRKGEKAIESLKHTYDLVYDSLKAQHTQYEKIFGTLQRQSWPTIDTFDPGEILPQLKRSKSLDSLIQGQALLRGPTHSRQGSIPKLGQMASNRQLIRTNSILPDPNKPIGLKEEFKVTKTTIPKHGMLQLLSDNQTGTALDSQKEEATRRLVKPSPLSHKKLQQKQESLLSKLGVSAASLGRRISVRPTAPAPVRYELPENYFAGYTIADIERRADQMVETATRDHRLYNMEVVKATAREPEKMPTLPPIETSTATQAENKTETEYLPSLK